MTFEFLFTLTIVVFLFAIIFSVLGGVLKLYWLLLIGILLGISALFLFFGATGMGIQQWLNQSQIILSLIKIPL